MRATKEKHGMWGTPEYRSWDAMLQRCYNHQHRSWANYGGRGITVCERWRNSFEAFYADMGNKPTLQHTIDRYPEKSGNYEPGNCRWATRKEQQRNTRTNHLLTFRGETLTMAEWAERLGFGDWIIESRLRRGWTIEKTLTLPLQPRQYYARKH